MEFLKAFRKSEDKREALSVKGLSPQYGLTYDGFWYFNRHHDAIDGRSDIKIRYGFDDPSILEKTNFLSKIGINSDPAIPHKYIGFSYAKTSQRQELEKYGRSFPYAELITALDDDGVITPESEQVRLV
jgi:hypothetical protein